MGLLRILHKRLVNYSDPNSFSSKMRRRRIAHLQGLIERISARRGRVRVLDVGGTRHYWGVLPQGFLQQHKVQITVLNLPGEVKEADDATFRFVEGDGCDMPFADDSFDLVHSNSVIEHVGRWKQMMAFADQTRRMADNYYLQTPYFWFPIETHFLAPFYHWLPEPVRVSINMRFAMASVKRPDVSRAMQEAIDDLRLLDQKMLKALLPDASIYWERFVGLRKSMIAIREQTT
jgi:hypothetical protein